MTGQHYLVSWSCTFFDTIIVLFTRLLQMDTLTRNITNDMPSSLALRTTSKMTLAVLGRVLNSARLLTSSFLLYARTDHRWPGISLLPSGFCLQLMGRRNVHRLIIQTFPRLLSNLQFISACVCMYKLFVHLKQSSDANV